MPVIDPDTLSEISEYADRQVGFIPGLVLEADIHFCEYLAALDGPRKVTIGLELLQVASQTCGVCRLLVEVTDQQDIDRSWNHIILTMVTVDSRDTFFVTGSNAATGAIEHSSLFFLAYLPITVVNGLDVLPCDTSSEISFSWAKEQIESCVSNHDCSHGTRTSLLPTRVLGVTSQHGQDMIKLLVTDRQDATYACLSHCWGNTSHMIKTKTHNLQSYLEGIRIADLPQTFQDAVDITRRLGIRYLWIDSLCIIQDSKEDWDAEAQRMADIYEGSYITIAATDSANGDGGCYRHHQPKNSDHNPIWYTTEDGEGLPVFSRQPHQHFKMNLESIEAPKGNDFPLLRRGWALQERLLSPRVLHFCHRELLFECRAGNQCQCGERKPEIGLKETFAKLLAGDTALDTRQYDRGWWAVTGQYTQLSLTFRKDMLLALSGIARRIGEVRPAGDYLGGIWKSTLPYGLLWFVPHLKLDDRSTDLYPHPHHASDLRVPSWSWASVVGPIRWELPGPRWNQDLVEIEHAECTTDAGDDGYGQILRASLKLTGPILASELTWGPLNPVFYEMGLFDWRLPELSEFVGRSQYSFFPDYAFFAGQESPISVLCLWFMPDVVLVLKGAADEGKFERIGLLHLYLEDSVALTSERLRQQFGTIELV
ncbi:hypothetical protein PG984_005250 [Apiospora sp. TS-2023a]